MNEGQLYIRQLRELLVAEFDSRHTLEQMARKIGYSPFHLQRLFTQSYGESPTEFLIRLRMLEAKRLLLRSNLTVSEVALEVGYQSSTTFTRRFAQLHGVPPQDFKKGFQVGALSKLKLMPACFLRA